MKNIAIFCDGTWQDLTQNVPTNVARLARSVAAQTKATDKTPACEQFVYYDTGVGVGQGVLDGATKLIGGSIGKGLDDKILNAYIALCLNFSPCDRIFIFGFSRGAYTARSLAGLLRRCWILRREHVGEADRAMDLYRNSTSEAPEVAKFKEDFCYPADAFIGQRGADPVDTAKQLNAAPAFWGHLQYVGVWDTVGSLGIPTALPFSSLVDNKYRFHDTTLSRFVLSARHAVSIDERRSTFVPTLWDNIDSLNINAFAGNLPYEKRPYQQIWFPGRHSGVGGGEDDGGLSIVPMRWIAEGAAAAGLEFNDDVLDLPPTADCCAPFVAVQRTIGTLVIEAAGEGDRGGPASTTEISDAARTRWTKLADYRPPPLSKFHDFLDAK
ncbi:MAG TPA: DUF2235 domain-containing protein [Micropepsaceae bacterium]|jgi:uncharacterized protein (DUF2235 family)